MEADDTVGIDAAGAAAAAAGAGGAGAAEDVGMAATWGRIFVTRRTSMIRAGLRFAGGVENLKAERTGQSLLESKNRHGALWTWWARPTLMAPPSPSNPFL
mmetsp:Transcript_14842/g.34442  ORF Transcript_14842/g.34442 Transcript_14842/m.34442 type:complete len:101 (-) Transcript_14842:132-434(-)